MFEIHWAEKQFGFGLGSVCQPPYADFAIELIPFVSQDGSGQVAGWGLWVGPHCNCRLYGTRSGCRLEAEQLLRRRFPDFWVRQEPQQGAA